MYEKQDEQIKDVVKRCVERADKADRDRWTPEKIQDLLERIHKQADLIKNNSKHLHQGFEVLSRAEYKWKMYIMTKYDVLRIKKMQKRRKGKRS